MLLMLSGALCECRGALRWQCCETGKLECWVGGGSPGAACMCKLISMRLPMCSHNTVRLLCIVVSSYRRCANHLCVSPPIL